MPFKDNLLKKIQIDALTQKVISSWGAPGSGQRIDKDAMRDLLEMSTYAYQKERDLDLFVADSEGEQKKILVLDNELPIYLTTVEDVVIRKSPYIKEMVSIRNMIKILKDSDVKISTKADSVRTIQQDCIGDLDLSYNKADIEEIAKDGKASLESGYAEGILENLALFSELLGYKPSPKAFRIRHFETFGATAEKAAGEILYGPIAIFSRINNSLKLIETPISSFDKKKLEYFQNITAGNQKADIEGQDVFQYLQEAVFLKADIS
jgi:hypothetical protein